MPEFLPLLPLRLVVYPGQSLNLHIFEPRYKQLINDCLEKEKMFGIPTYLNNEVQEFGCIVKVLKIEKTYPNGEMDIRTEGVEVFRVLEFLKELPEKLYPGGIISTFGSPTFDKIGIYDRVADLVDKLHKSVGLEEPIFNDYQKLQSYDLVKYIGLNLSQQYQLLSIKSEAKRQGLILEHLKSMVPSIEESEALLTKIRANGYFRKEIPPEL